MTDNEKITTVRTLVGDNTAIVDAYLATAKDAILQRAYPFANEAKEMPTRYDYLQCRLAARHYFRAGGEGEIMHQEGGINRTYDSVNDEDLLAEVMQVVRL